MKHRHVLSAISRYILVFAALLAAGVLCLFLVGLIPQELVFENVKSSVDQLVAEDLGYRILDQTAKSNQFDTWTDTRILLQSLYLDTVENPASVFTNAFWSIDTSGNTDYILRYVNPLESLAALKEMPAAPQPNAAYARYCMGFRILIRPLLAIGSYSFIRQCIAYTLAVVLFFVILGTYKRLGTKAALIVLFSYMAINPIMLASSPQYASCALLAALPMLCLLYIPCMQHHFPMIMFCTGAITQFFDFYTYPILTVLFPLGLYILLEQQAGRGLRMRELLQLSVRSILLWAVAYIGMWLCKLALTELFTKEAAFSSAMGAMSEWLGFSHAEVYGQTGLMKKIAILLSCFHVFFTENLLNRVITLAMALLWCAGFLLAKGQRRTLLLQAIVWGILAAIPVVWLFVSARAVELHMCFQYRMLGGTFFMVCCAVLSLWNQVAQQRQQKRETVS